MKDDMATHRQRGYGNNPRNPHGQYIGKRPSDDFDWDNAITRFKKLMRNLYRHDPPARTR
jgi:hypothetical protein